MHKAHVLIEKEIVPVSKIPNPEERLYEACHARSRRAIQNNQLPVFDLDNPNDGIGKFYQKIHGRDYASIEVEVITDQEDSTFKRYEELDNSEKQAVNLQILGSKGYIPKVAFELQRPKEVRPSDKTNDYIKSHAI
jgi:hypothetical protein